MGVSLLPLPLEEARRSTVSPCAKSLRRHRGLGKHIDEVCDAINSLSSAKAGAALRPGEAPRDLFSATPSQLEARRGIGRQVRRLGVPGPPAGALEKLLKTTDLKTREIEVDDCHSCRKNVQAVVYDYYGRNCVHASALH